MCALGKIQNHIDGITIRYSRHFAGAGKPQILLFLPFGSSLDSANAFVETHGKNFSILTWKSRHIFDDEPNIIDSALTVDRHVDDAIALLDFFRIDRAVIVGYCSGAAIALALAAQKPEVAIALFLVSGEYGLVRQRLVTNHFRQVDQLLKAASKNEHSSATISKNLVSFAENDNISKEAKYFNAPYFNPVFLQRYSLNYLNFLTEDFCATAIRVTNPSFVYCSTDDTHVSVAASQKISNLLGQSRLTLASFGDHYGFCRPNSEILSQIKSDCMRYSHEAC